MQALIYRTLCVIQLYHRYFLNRGEELFEDMSERDKAIQLQKFDWRNILHVFPIGGTQKTLQNNHMLIRYTADSFRILIRILEADSRKPFVPVALEETLLFGIGFRDPLLENFTEMKFLGDRKIFLANNLPETAGFDAVQPLPVDEDQAFSELFTIDGATFGDFLAEQNITAPSSLKGILSLQMKGISGDYNILNEAGTTKMSPTTFFLTFNNRKTIWRYLQPASRFAADTLLPKPLTKSGFVTLDAGADFDHSTQFPTSFHFPNPNIHSLKRDENKFISEIYL
jgi:hypothetical protein